MVRAALRPWNTHWHTSRISPLIMKHPRPRAVVPHWVDELLDPPQNQWTLRIGPRQTGKTTSLGHVADQLIHEHEVAPEHVVIAPMDQEEVRETCDERLHVLIDSLLEQAPATPHRPLYLLLDEIQTLPEWGRSIKTAWDRYSRTVRVLATGSSALKLLRPPQADFPGRILTRSIHPLKFKEVVLTHPDFVDHASDDEQQELVRLAYQTRSSLRSSADGFSSALGELTSFVQSFETLDTFLSRLFLEYITWGGYPACSPASQSPPAQKAEFFQAALNAIIAQDLYGKISNPPHFERLFRHISLNPGGKFAPFNLATRLSVSGQTAASWKAILEDVLIVQQLSPLKPNFRHDTGKDKAYPTDPGWISYHEGKTTPHVEEDDSRLGARVETVLVDHARRLQFNLNHTTSQPIGYVAKPEVDIALKVGDRWVLVESKYSRRIRESPLAQIGDSSTIRLVATKNQSRVDEGKDAIHLLPAHLWAMIC